MTTPPERFRRLTRLLAAAWWLLLSASFVYFWRESRHTAVDLARVEAQASYDKDLLYRRWVSGHGGVYVPPTKSTPPNPYLQVPNRDIETKNGVPLTLVNPAYMTRQVHDLAASKAGSVRGHITSLRPIRPQNAPDAWETAALQAFEQGARQMSGVVSIDGQDVLRFMRPMTTEASCLKCHAQQGYRVGDVRGGISVSVPLQPYQSVAFHQLQSIAAVHLLLAVVGFVGIRASTRRLQRYMVDLERSQEELQGTETTLRRLVEVLPDAVIVHAGGEVLFANAAAARMLAAASPEDLVGRSLFDFALCEEKGCLTGEPGCTSGIGEGRLRQMRFARLDGTALDAEVTGCLISYRGREAVQVVARNITERLHLESQLRQSQKLEAVGQLAGGVAHDFNNILAATMMQLGLLLTRARLEPEVRTQLEELGSGIERASNLTRQLLMFSRRSPLRVAPLDLGGIVDGMLKMLRRVIGENIEVRFERPSRLPMIDADAGMMEQVLLNLVVNARDAMPKGGRLSIALTSADVPASPAGEEPARSPGHYVCLAVTDTGCGMTEAVQKHVFEPFFTTKEVGQGTGLGLATVYGIVKQHHGWVDVESRVGAGSTFRVYLPAANSEVPQRPAATIARENQGHEVVLLVEDDASVRRLASKGLTAAGYRVLEASNAQEALALWQPHASTIALLFTDLVMSGATTGVELARQLRSLRPDLKVLLSSGYSPDLSGLGDDTLSGAAYLAKPYQLSTLLATVRSILDQQDTAGSLGSQRSTT